MISILRMRVHRRLALGQESAAQRAKDKNSAVLLQILETAKSLDREGIEPTFNAILGELRSERVLSNHTTLRAYLDLLVKAEMLSVKEKAARQPNVRPKQVYSLYSREPLVEVGEKALLFHGLNWTLPSASSLKERTDIEGLSRSRLGGGTVYGSLEDAVIAGLARGAASKNTPRALAFCAALLATRRVDFEYLDRRATERGIVEVLNGLVEEIAFVLESPRPEVQDVRTLSLVRKHLGPRFRPPRVLGMEVFPFPQEELVDILGKQLGVK